MLSPSRRCRFAMRMLDPPTAHISCLRIITLRGLHRDMAKKKLNLLQLATGSAAEARAASSQIMGRKFADASFGGELFNDMPDQLFRYGFAPNFTGAAHAPEKAACRNSGGRRPIMQ
jgi:hypothetical protein